MNFFSEILIPLTLSDLNQVHEDSSNIDFQQSSMMIKNNCLSFEIKFKEEAGLTKYFMRHITKKKQGYLKGYFIILTFI